MEQQWNKCISIGRLPVRRIEVNQININHFTFITAGALISTRTHNHGLSS